MIDDWRDRGKFMQIYAKNPRPPIKNPRLGFFFKKICRRVNYRGNYFYIPPKKATFVRRIDSV